VRDVWRLQRVEQAEHAYFEQIRLAARVRAQKNRSVERSRLLAAIDGGDRSMNSSNTTGFYAAGHFLAHSVDEDSGGQGPSSVSTSQSSLHLAAVRGMQAGPQTSSDTEVVMLDGMVDPDRAFPYGTLTAIRQSLLRGILRKRDKLSEIRRAWP
jgi:hypothetical protein